jgi:hypothetical protein
LVNSTIDIATKVIRNLHPATVVFNRNAKSASQTKDDSSASQDADSDDDVDDKASSSAAKDAAERHRDLPAVPEAVALDEPRPKFYEDGFEHSFGSLLPATPWQQRINQLYACFMLVVLGLSFWLVYENGVSLVLYFRAHLTASVVTDIFALAMLALFALGPAVALSYARRPQIVQGSGFSYSLVRKRPDLSAKCTHDVRPASFRSVNSKSEDFILDPLYYEYQYTEFDDTGALVMNRPVIISMAAYNMCFSPLNTLRWVEVEDMKNLRRDTHGFARTVMQSLNLHPQLEATHDVLFETIKMFACKMKVQRRFPDFRHEPLAV